MVVLENYDNNTCMDVYFGFNMYFVITRYDFTISCSLVLRIKVLAHIVASGNDPYATFTFHDGKSIDPDTCKWAAIKYRTITEKDNTGVS